MQRPPSGPVARPGPDTPEPEFKYRAFLSYSHRDKATTDRLHRFLETYRVPKALVGRSSRDGPVPARLFPIFRDREELPIAAELGSNLEEALRVSRYLLVVCSPHAAASRWVNEEIRAFKAMGREERVLALVVDGEPNASDRPDSGLPECLPPALRFRVGADGRLTSERTEPIAADAREGKDGERVAWWKVVAGLLGVGFTELYDRERARRRRRRLLGALVSVVFLALLGGVWWFGERSKARELDRQAARELLVRARQAVAADEDRDAALYFAEANRRDPDRTSRESALVHLAVVGVPRHVAALGEPACWVASSRDGRRFLAMGERGLVRVFDAATATRVSEHRIGVETFRFRRASFSPDGRFVFAAAEYARTFDTETGVPRGVVIPFPLVSQGGAGVREIGGVERAALDPTGASVVVAWEQDGLVEIFDARTGESTSPRAPRGGDGLDLAFLRDDDPIPGFHPDRMLRVLSHDGTRIELRRVPGGERVGEPLQHDGLVLALAFAPTGEAVVTGGTDRRARAWDVSSGRAMGVSSRHPREVSLVRCSPDGRFVLTVSGDAAFLWSRSLALEMVMPHASDVAGAVFSGDGAGIVTASKDGTVATWRIDDRRARPRATSEGWRDTWRPVAIGPRGEVVLAERRRRRASPIVGTDGRLARPVDDPISGIALFEPGNDVPRWVSEPVEERILAAEIRRDGRRLATIASAGDAGAPSCSVRIRDAGTGAPIGAPYVFSASPSGDSEAPAALLRWSPDGASLLVVVNTATLVPSGEGLRLGATLEILDASTGRPSRPARSLPSRVVTADWLVSDGVLLAMGGGVRRLRPDADAPDDGYVVPFDRIVSAAVSPDERTLLVASREAGRLFDLATGRALGVPLRRESMTERHGAEFSPDGRLALTWDGGTVRLLDARTGWQIGTTFALGDRTGAELGVRFSDPTRLIGWTYAGIERFDVAFWMRELEPDALVAEVGRLTHRELGPDGAARARLPRR